MYMFRHKEMYVYVSVCMYMYVCTSTVVCATMGQFLIMNIVGISCVNSDAFHMPGLCLQTSHC